MAPHPAKLGKYEVTGVLGEGAMGVVYKGFDPDIRRVVALKTIRHQPGHGPEALAQSLARFRNEAQAAGRLTHPGIVGVYDFGESGFGAQRVAFIAMEYVEGHTLTPYLAQKVKFGEGDVASIGAQLAEALAHAHEHGVWHRDVKPSNVIMTKSGRVKIADFGIARTDTSALTMAGSVLGTPMYMAPEQFMGRAIDHRVDVYGIGVVLYQVVAGRAPFIGPPDALMFKVVNEAPPPPSTIEGGLGIAAFDAVIAQALAKRPEDRYANASALRMALAQAAGGAVPAMVSHEAVYALPMASDYAPTERLQRREERTESNTGSTPQHWDRQVLAQVEAVLARHVGPMAGVMVRRAARDCADLPALYARLGEQITQASAREAFLAQTAGARTGGSGNTGSGGATPGPSTFTGAAALVGPPISQQTLDAAQRLLAAQLGPIAKVLVRRAAERTRERGEFFAALADAVPEAARARLLAELGKLP